MSKQGNEKEITPEGSEGPPTEPDVDDHSKPTVLDCVISNRESQAEGSQNANRASQDTSFATQEHKSREPVQDLDALSEAPVCNHLYSNVKVKYTEVTVKDGVTSTKSSDTPQLSQGSSTHVNNGAAYAMEFTSHYNKDNERTKTTVTLYSEGLRTLIQRTIAPLLAHENSLVFDALPVTIQASNVLVLHSWDKLWAAAETSDGVDSESSREELQCYLKILTMYESDTLQARDAALKEGQVEYSKMWTLFPPGSEVIATPFQDSHQIFTVYRHGPSPEGNGFQFACWAYDWNGKELLRTAHEFVVPKFTGLKKVTELQVYPVSFYRNGDEGPEELRKRLTKRGHRFETFCKQVHSGPGTAPKLWKCDKYTTTRRPNHEAQDVWTDPLDLLLHSRMRATISTTKGEMSAPVIIDPEEYAVRAPTPNVRDSPLHLGNMVPRAKDPCMCSLCTLDGARTAWDKQFANAQESSQTETATTTAALDPDLRARLYSQLPPRVLGFIVDQKCWGQLQVDHISEDEPMSQPSDNASQAKFSSAWSDLVVDDEPKEHIERMVRNHFKVSEAETLRLRIQDPVKDKGQGLVILLHGLPGLGKTMTAEGLAQRMNRRLIRIDATDFDYNNPGQVSRAFKKYFHCAYKWGTLLLLDEADVFLHTRAIRGLTQNALVSVLLRELEYFKGVLIMTTNRVKTMDTAMESRIHYIVKFRDLDPVTFVKVFRTFEKQLNNDNCSPEDREKILDHVEENASDFVQKQLTGRHIRNILTTAQLLDWPYITFKNFKAILRNTGNFRQDMAVHTKQEHDNVAISGTGG